MEELSNIAISVVVSVTVPCMYTIVCWDNRIRLITPEVNMCTSCLEKQFLRRKNRSTTLSSMQRTKEERDREHCAEET